FNATVIDKFGAFNTRITDDGEITSGIFSLDVVDVSPDTFAAWTDVDVSGYIASDATGVILEIVGTGANAGVRKNGSTDDRRNVMEHDWAMIGVDANGVFEAWANDANVIINLVGYTDANWTYNTNADDVSLVPINVWTDIDVSTEAPNATGVIVEIISTGNFNVGLRMNGSGDNRVVPVIAGSHLFTVIGVDAGQIFEGQISNVGADFYLIGYVTDGATFNLNFVDKSLPGIGAWTDIDASVEAPDAEFLIFEVIDTGFANNTYGFRKNGSTDTTVDSTNDALGWAIVPCDENQIVEGRIENLNVDFFLIGYITSGGYLYYTETSASENQGLKVVAEGITEGEYALTTSIKDDPGIASYDASVNIGVSMGSGILPVRILEKQTAVAPTASFTFSNIDTKVADWDAKAGVTSRHLVVMVNAASPDAVSRRDVRLRLNGDAGNNYNFQRLIGENVVATASAITGTSYINPLYIPGTTYANAFGGGIILIPHAVNTNNHKAVLARGGSAEGRVSIMAGRWADTDAIDTILLYLSAGNFITGSTFILGVVDERYLVEEAINPAADFLPVFDTIPQDGNDLVAIIYARSDRVATTDEMTHEINNDNAAGNYFFQAIRGQGAVTAAFSLNNNKVMVTSAASSSANTFYGGLINYSQYEESTNDISINVLSGGDRDVNARVVARSTRWNNVAAITKLEYFPGAGTNFEAGSLFSLYRVPRFLIDRQELAAPAATITFNNIPQGYEALQLNIYARSDLVANGEEVKITFNADAVAGNYDYQQLRGSGAVVSAARNAASQVVMVIPAANVGANEFGGAVVTLNQYSTTVGHKHFTILTGVNENQVIIRSSRWEDSSAITRIDLDLALGGNFIAGSVFELVGVMPTKSFMIEIDGEVEAIEAAGSASVIDNTSDWIIGGDATPYIEQYEHRVGGVLVSDISWEYAATFTDASGNGNDATPTFRIASMDADVVATLTTFQPISEAKAPDFTLADSIPFIEGTGNMTGNFTTAPTIPGTGFPLAGVISAVAGATTPPQLPLMMIAVFVILTFSLGYSSVTRRFGSGSIFGKAFVIIAVMSIFAALGNFGIDFWMIVTFAILVTALAMASRQQSWQ
ncbi:hypothetical protein LCGC14_1210400, partial [marine sediment metagenome]